MKEKDFEDILVKYPELIEPELELIGRQVDVYGRRIDLLLKDKFGNKLIVELKKGPIKDAHVGQILSYEGMILSHDDPTVRVMLIGTRVPPNIQKSLDHHGIAWKEITFSKLKEFLTQKNDKEFLHLFTEDNTLKLRKPKNERRKRTFKSSPHPSLSPDASAALFAPVKKQWIDEAFDYFKGKKEKLYFSTNANIGIAKTLNIKNVYFKMKGDIEIAVKADFIDITSENPKLYRLAGNENIEGKYYYGFKNLRFLQTPVELTQLNYFTTATNLKKSTPGACIIQDPNVE